MAVNNPLKIANVMNTEQRLRFAKILMEWLERSNISMREGARRLGVSSAAVRAWCKGENSINWEDFERFASILGKTPECLLAEVRGVVFEQMPAEFTYQDVERVAAGLTIDDKTRLIHSLVESLRPPAAPEKKEKAAQKKP